MFEHLSVQAITDILFSILVVVVCLSSLAGGIKGIETKAQKWRAELAELQKALKELIEDASTQSHNLDQRLLKRKEELEALLNEFQKTEKKAKDSELPNSSWELSSRKNSLDTSARQVLASSDQYGETYCEYNDCTEEPKPVKPETRRVEPRSAKQKSPKPKITRPISKKIDKVDSQISSEVSEFMNKLDPMTVTIAKRLITEGHEIHVVARKLALPVAQVRILERVIRGDETSTTQTIGEKKRYYKREEEQVAVNAN